MKTILNLARKDVLVLMRDPMGFFFILGFPTIMGIAFGLINSGFQSDGEVQEQMVAVVDEDTSPISRKFVEALDAIEAVKVDAMDFDAARDSVRKGDRLGLIRIPAGYGRTAGMLWEESPAIGVGVDPSRKAEAGMMQGWIMQAAGSLVQERFKDTGAMRERALENARKFMEDGSIPPDRRQALSGFMTSLDRFLGEAQAVNDPAAEAEGRAPKMDVARIETIDIRKENRFTAVTDRLQSGFDISFPSAMLWGVMGCVAGFAISIARERSAGTLFRLRVSPASHSSILLGKAAACFATALAVIVFLTLLGLSVGLQLVSPLGFVAAALSTAAGFTGLMMLMSVVGRTEQAVSGAGWALIVVLCLLGGGMIPLAFMPPAMQSVSNLSPVKWGILAIEGGVWRDFGFMEMAKPCAVLLAMGLAGFVCGARLLARRLD